MSKAKFVPLILLLFGVLAFVSCSSETTNPDESRNSSSSVGGGTSSSTIGGGGSSSSTIGGLYSSSSSELEDWEWEWEWLDACPGTEPKKDTAIYSDDFTDSRDGGNGETYKTVKIGNQTWMAKNLNYKPSSAPGLHKCYAEGYGGDTWLEPNEPQVELNCNKFGRLYDWETAKSICPDGWHLPNALEWKELREYIEETIFCKRQDEYYGWGVGTKLKATSGWEQYSGHGNGIDTYGFSAIGSGYCSSCSKDALGIKTGYYAGILDKGNGNGEIAHWWSATEFVNPYTGDDKTAYRFTVAYNNNEFIEKYFEKSDLYSIRCVKN